VKPKFFFPKIKFFPCTRWFTQEKVKFLCCAKKIYIYHSVSWQL
jgi:hypothetical protein